MTGKKPLKGQMTGKQAEAKAQQAHRKEAFRKAKQGKGPAPEYTERRRGWFR